MQLEENSIEAIDNQVKILKKKNRKKKIALTLGISIIALLVIIPLSFSLKEEIDNINSSLKFERLGNECFYEEKYQDAIDYYNLAIYYNAGNIRAWHYMGKSYEELEEYQEAIKWYTELLQMEPEYAVVYRSRGYIYYLQGKLDKSLDDYLKSLSLEPENDAALGNVGSIYEDLCEFEKARQYYYLSLKYDSISGSINYGNMDALASIEFDLGNYEECIELCYKIIGNLDEGKDSPHGNLGLSYSAIGKYDSSIVHYSKALEYNPNWCHYYNNRGHSLACIGKKSEAIDDYNKAIAINENNPTYFLNRGEAESALGMNELALNDFNQAILLAKQYDGYDVGICYYNRAMVKREIGDSRGYKIDMDKATELGYPDSHQQYTNLGEKADFYLNKKKRD